MEKYDFRLRVIADMTKKGMKQTKIAEIMGVSKQRIGQLIRKAENQGIDVVRRQLKKSFCKNCGAEYPGINKFCSRECRESVPRKFGGPSSEIELEIMICDGCGTKFSRTRRLTYIRKKASERTGRVLKRTFCTKDCYLKNGVSRT